MSLEAVNEMGFFETSTNAGNAGNPGNEPAQTQTFIETKTDGLWRPKVNPGQTGERTETEDRNQG